MISGDPIVSIVIPAWKPRADWLRHAVTSAVGQRDCSVEVIVVDDGSPAPVADLLSDLDHPALRVVREPHRGVAEARNVGIDLARGQYIRFADADDVLELNSTARLVGLAGGDDVITFGATLVCDDQLRPIGMKRSELSGWIAEKCLLYRFDVRHMSMLFPRLVVDAVGRWEPTLRQCEDWDFVLRALEHAPVRGNAEIATYYRKHATSVSSNIAASLLYESKVVDRYFERHPEQAGTSLEREARAKLLIVSARAARSLGKGRAGQLRLVARALALHPQRTCEELGRVLLEHGDRALARASRR